MQRSRSSNTKFLCKCTLCLEENPNGCDVGSAATFYAHKRAEALQRSLASEGLDELGRTTTLRTVSQSVALHLSASPQGSSSMARNSSSASRQSTNNPLSSQHASRVFQALRDLNHVRDQFIQASLSYSPSGHLTFIARPSEYGQYNHQDGVSGVNKGRHALDLRNPENCYYLQHETTLYHLLEQLDGIPGYDTDEIRIPRKSLVDKIHFELERLDRMKEQEWECQRAESCPGKALPHANVVDTSTLLPCPAVNIKLIEIFKLHTFHVHIILGIQLF